MSHVYDEDGLLLIHADVMDGLAALPDESVQTCVTSPPYWGLRDYGVEGSFVWCNRTERQMPDGTWVPA